MTRGTRTENMKRTTAGLRPARLFWAAAAACAAAAAYMVFEAQWVRCRKADLPVPGLPSACRGLTILHLSDVHAGLFPVNERALRKAVEWGGPLDPDLVFLTGDMVGQRRRSRRCLDLLARLQPPLGMYAVTGNHEYGLGKGPLARARDAAVLREIPGVTLLQDRCVRSALDGTTPTTLVICGADYLTGGHGLTDVHAFADSQGRDRGVAGVGGLADGAPRDMLAILLIHEPPAADSPLAAGFDLAFAGHTHGGQIRVPRRGGIRPLHEEDDPRLAGVHPWGRGRLVISPGLGTSFLPFRLLTRPQTTLWRLV